MKKLFLIILLLLLAGCAAPGAAVQSSSTPLPQSVTPVSTKTILPTYTITPIETLVPDIDLGQFAFPYHVQSVVDLWGL